MGSSRPNVLGALPDRVPLRSELCSSCREKSMMRYSCRAAASSGERLRLVARPLLATVAACVCVCVC